METLYFLIDMLGMYICLICCIIVIVEKKASVNQKYLLMMFICGFVTAVGNMLEFRSTVVQEALLATKVAYVGKCFIMLFALRFVTEFSRIKMPESVFKLIAIINMIILGIIMSCEKNMLYYSNIDFQCLESGRHILILEKGVFYYIWCIQLFLSGMCYIVIAGYEVIRGNRKFKLRMLLIMLAAVLPFVMLFFVMFINHNIWDTFDPTTLAVVIPEIILLIDVKIFGFPDTMELAQERVLEDTKDGILVVDNEYRSILYMNPVAKELFPMLDKQSKKEAIAHIFKGEENILHIDGKNYEIRISEIMNEQKKGEVQGYLAWIFDMTFINQYTNEMIQLKEESEQANIAKTNFLAHMSHEIRTPMNAIVGYAELALHTKEQEQTNNYLENIKDSAKTLLNLINEILDISKIETGKMKVVNVPYRFDKLMHELYAMMTAQAEKQGLLFIMRIDEKIPCNLVGDRVKIQEIFTNLINNGLKYTREGKVTLKINKKDQQENRILLHIEVEDTGIGIEEKNFSKVFAKFEQFDKKKNYNVEGTGLGLSIVKNFVEMMNGTITFESEYGKGTKFILELWQEIGVEDIYNDEPEEPLSQECGEIAIRSGKILVVDDNELNCDVAQGILDCMGMQTEICFSGVDCLKRLQAGEEYELIFMDHMMPEMDGVETLHKIRELGGRFETLPVVLLTANAVRGVKEEMLKEGFDDFLSKPIDIDELRHVLLTFLGAARD